VGGIFLWVAGGTIFCPLLAEKEATKNYLSLFRSIREGLALQENIQENVGIQKSGASQKPQNGAVRLAFERVVRAA
jgi:hypothetical protein